MLKPPSTVSRVALVRLPLTDVLMPRPVMMSSAFGLRSRRARDEGDELQVVAAVQGQVLDLLAVDRPRDLAGDRVDGLALHRDLDRLGEAADLER